MLCGQVCPTGAIQKITECRRQLGTTRPAEQKPISIGTAFYDQGRCLPWSMADALHRLRRVLPDLAQGDLGRRGRGARSATSKSAPNGEQPAMKTVKVQRPHVDPSLCIGCGACEKVCPVVDKPAVYVTSVGETRSKTNVILLENTSYGQS